jgi:hypothetical protein
MPDMQKKVDLIWETKTYVLTRRTDETVMRTHLVHTQKMKPGEELLKARFVMIGSKQLPS